MKTNSQPRKLVIIVSITTLIFILLCASTHGYGQVRCDDHFKPGFVLGSYSSGNGHGTSYEVLGSLQSHRSTLMAGPTFQKAARKLNGIKVWYSYSLTGVEPSCKRHAYATDTDIELAFFAFAQYYNGAVLSKATLRAEGDLDAEMHSHYTSLRMNTVELAGGMSFNFKLGEHLKIRTYVGVSYYNHLNFNESMFHSKNAAVLMTGLGIGFNK